MTLEAISFEGHECVRLHDGGVTVMVTTSESWACPSLTVKVIWWVPV